MAEFGIGVGGALVVEEIDFGVFIVRVWGEEHVAVLCFGDGEQEFVLPVSAHAGSADFLSELDDTGRVWAFGYHVTDQNDVVVFVVEVELLEEVLKFLSAAVDVADEDEAVVVVGEVLLVHVANLYHALECRAHVVAVAHGRCIVHEVELCFVYCAPWAKVCPPTYQEEDEDGEIC